MTNSERLNSIVTLILMLPDDANVDWLSSETVDTWDSLNHINLIGAIEQEFDVTIDTRQVEHSRSVPTLKAILAEHGVEFDGDVNP